MRTCDLIALLYPVFKNPLWGFSRKTIHVCSDRGPSCSSAQGCQMENKSKLSQERLHLKIGFQGLFLSSCDQWVRLLQQVEFSDHLICRVYDQGLGKTSFLLSWEIHKARNNQVCGGAECLTLRSAFSCGKGWVLRRGCILAHSIQGLGRRKET